MPAREPRPSGFTLVEVAIALVILSLALLLGMSFILGEARAVRRLDADRAARAALAGTLEAIRAGALPLGTAHLDGGDLAAASGGSWPADLAIDVAVTPASPPGLYEIALTARYKVAGEARERRLGSLISRPSGAEAP
jgi:prepilin-type N-terminal cleavage/methylation domain-containing protein